MNLLHSFALTATLFILSVQNAVALSVDDTSMNVPGKSEQFSDPDEKTPMQALHMNGSAPVKNAAQDPSTVRYDYDPQNGTYVPHDPANDKN